MKGYGPALGFLAAAAREAALERHALGTAGAACDEAIRWGGEESLRVGFVALAAHRE